MKSVSELTDDEVCVMCAEAVGWQRNDTPTSILNPWWYKAWPYAEPTNYPSDLNACSELRATLTEEERIDYAWELYRSGGARAAEDSFSEWFAIADAKPRLHCNAFLIAKKLALP